MTTPKLSWGLVFALALLGGTLFAVERASRPFLERFKGRAFAMSTAERQGFAAWPLEAANDYGTEARYLFRNPSDPGSFSDLRIELRGGHWAVKQLNKDFRPWQGFDEQASR